MIRSYKKLSKITWMWYNIIAVPVAQLDRVPVSEAVGRKFESCLGHQLLICLVCVDTRLFLFYECKRLHEIMLYFIL